MDPTDVIGFTGLDYAFQDGVPTAQPQPSNGIHYLPVDRVPLDPTPSPLGPASVETDQFFHITPVNMVPASPLGFQIPELPNDIGGGFIDIGGDMFLPPSVTIPDDVHYMPPADEPPPPPTDDRPGIRIPQQPSDIGGFIPDVPDLPTQISPETPTSPTDGTGTTGDDTTEQPKTTTDRLIDLVASMFSGGGGGGGGIAALPTGIVQPASSQSSNKGILVVFILIGVGLLAFWYFKKRKGK